MSDQWLIMGRYKGEIEEVDSAKNKQEAEYLANEYRIAFGRDWVITIKKKRG